MTQTAMANATSAFILRTPARVYCPGCGCALSQRTFHFAYSVMWCLRCGEQPIHPHDWLAFALRWNGFSHEWLIVRGIRLWVPDDPGDGITSKYIRDRRAVKFSREQLEHFIRTEAEHEEKLRRETGKNEGRVAMEEGHGGTRSI